MLHLLSVGGATPPVGRESKAVGECFSSVSCKPLRMMSSAELYYFIEGIAMMFFGIMAVQNLWQRDHRLRFILGWVLLYWTVQHVCSVVFAPAYLSESRRYEHIISAFDITAAPTCCFLLLELCRPGWLTWRKVLWHELPFVVLGAASILTDSVTVHYLLIGVFVLYGIGVSAATVHYITLYNKFLRAHYSYEENVNLRWLYAVLLTFLLLMLVYAVCSIYNTLPGDRIYVAGSIVGWAMICYFIRNQESVLYELEAARSEETGDGPDDAAAEDAPDLGRLIEERFIAPQLYLNPQLKLGDMAQAIGTNRTYLSQYLNKVLKTSFYEYVNTLRLEHALRLIEHSQYSIKSIAAIAGFNSYSTFRRTFIAKYHLPPQEYRQNKL